jgi:predicted nucleic acid-binding protein
LLKGVDELRFRDIEDSCQYQLAKKYGCDILVTFNTADFPETAVQEVEIVSPIEFTL